MESYNELLKKGEEIRPLHIFGLIDLRDYVDMCKRNLIVRVKWNFIRDMIVTTNGRTLWQLMDDYWRKHYQELGQPMPIGIEYPPTSLIEWVLTKQ